MSQANDEATEQAALEQLGTDLCRQAMETRKLILANGEVMPLEAREVLRVAVWAASRRQRRDKGFPLPKEAFLPETTDQ